MRSLELAPYGARAFMASTTPQWKALYRRLSFLDEAPPGAAGHSTFAVYYPEGGGVPMPVIVIYIDPEQHGGEVAQLVNTCAHEAQHATSQLFEYIGHNPVGADEPSAYLVGALTQWLYEGVVE